MKGFRIGERDCSSSAITSRRPVAGATGGLPTSAPIGMEHWWASHQWHPFQPDRPAMLVLACVRASSCPSPSPTPPSSRRESPEEETCKKETPR